MDTIPIWTVILTLLLPYATKAGEKIAEKTGESIYNSIESWFTRKKDKEGIKALKAFSKNPAKHGDSLEKLLKARCSDTDFLNYLQTVLESNADTNESIKQNIKIESGGTVGDVVGKVNGDFVKGDKKTTRLG